MMSSVAPYKQLVRQVEALKAENSHLRRELRDNSSHLSKLETETSGMKVGGALGGGCRDQSCRDRAQGGGPRGGHSGPQVCHRDGRGSRPVTTGALPTPTLRKSSSAYRASWSRRPECWGPWGRPRCWSS